MAALRIPKGKVDGAVAPSLEGTGAAIDGGAGARDDEVVAFPTAASVCGTLASAHVGELGRATLRRSMHACRAR